MNNNKLFIPNKLLVGFVNKNDTYTKKLAYITYYDYNNNLRKEYSWSNWRDKNIPSLELDNVPIEGFVLNKNGGGRYSQRNEFVRVYDPREFEFEISFDNLIFILEHCDSYKGKGLDGQFVYSWNRDKLVLLPVNCEDYKNSINYTKLKSKKFSMKNLVPGYSYIDKNQNVFIYVGRYYFYDHQLHYYYYKNNTDKKPEKKYIFYNGKYYVILNNIVDCVSEEIPANFNKIVFGYESDINASPIKNILMVDFNDKLKSDFLYHFDSNNNCYKYSFVNINVYNNKTKQYELVNIINVKCIYYLNKYNVLNCLGIYKDVFSDDINIKIGKHCNYDELKFLYNVVDKKVMVVEFENGLKIIINENFWEIYDE